MDDSETYKDDKAVRESFENTAKKGLHVLDLNRKEIQQMPSEMHDLDLSHLKYLYLEGNTISSLPEDFFTCLVSLEWLDLRNNKLCEIPTNVGEHKNLRTLLLGRNQLTFLPAEIGFLKTLTGLNLSDNPLEDPPQSVIAKGVCAVKKYLLEKLGINTEDCQIDETESEYQSAKSSDDSQGDSDEFTKESKSIGDEKEKNNDVLSNGNPPAVESVPPAVTMSYYGALLGDIPNSYIFKPWKTGVYFKNEELDGKLSVQKVEHENGTGQ